MQYIIMCGGNYQKWETPRQLMKIHGEEIVARTIRLLKKAGVKHIAISSNNPVFKKFNIPVLVHDNPFRYLSDDDHSGHWYDAFYPADVPVCYIFGDVVFSQDAINTIVKEETDDIQFFASAPPFTDNYCKPWAEPFAFKVVNMERFKECLKKIKQLDEQKKFNRIPIAWELWQVIKDTPLNKIDYTNYRIINDYTCDIDNKEDIKKLEKVVPPKDNIAYMIHTCPKREWYVNEYLIPSMLAQGIKEENITVFNDNKNYGNLKACIESFKLVDTSIEGTWHLQDDIIISRDFKEKTEQYNSGLVCGFCSKYDVENAPSGRVNIKHIWWSFPCIRIPNKYAVDWAYWIDRYIIGNCVYFDYWKEGILDDFWFKKYMLEKYPNLTITNLEPNIIDHIDYLIGGSVIGVRKKDTIVRSMYWEDEDLVEELADKLRGRE